MYGGGIPPTFRVKRTVYSYSIDGYGGRGHALRADIMTIHLARLPRNGVYTWFINQTLQTTSWVRTNLVLESNKRTAMSYFVIARRMAEDSWGSAAGIFVLRSSFTTPFSIDTLESEDPNYSMCICVCFAWGSPNHNVMGDAKACIK